MIKKLIPLTTLLFFFYTVCFGQPKFKQVSEEAIDREAVIFAENLSLQLLSAQKKGDFYKFKDGEATSAIIKQLDRKRQRASYEQIKSAVGDFQGGVEFREMWVPMDGSLFEIYRFKGDFDPKADVEVRAVLDAEGKLAGFFVKPWQVSL